MHKNVRPVEIGARSVGLAGKMHVSFDVFAQGELSQLFARRACAKNDQFYRWPRIPNEAGGPNDIVHTLMVQEPAYDQELRPLFPQIFEGCVVCSWAGFGRLRQLVRDRMHTIRSLWIVPNQLRRDAVRHRMQCVSPGSQLRFEHSLQSVSWSPLTHRPVDVETVGVAVHEGQAEEPGQPEPDRTSRRHCGMNDGG